MFPAYVILEGIESLPTLPEAVTRLAVLLKDERAGTADFEKAVRHDLAITTNIIHSANSVHFGGSSPINTLHEAIARIGLQRVFEVSIGSTLKRAIPKRIPGYGVSAKQYWLHCIAAACISETLARELKLESAEMAFTAGLLHDVGQLVIGNFLDEVMPEANWWTFGTHSEERKTLGCNHTDVGQEIAVRWNLPSVIKQTCRWHHEFDKAPKDCDANLVAVVHISDAFAYITGFPGGSCMGEAYDKDTLQHLGINLKQLMELSMSIKPLVEEQAACMS